MGTTLGDKSDLIKALHSQIFEYSRETCCRHALEYLQSARSEKQMKKKTFSYGNA